MILFFLLFLIFLSLYPLFSVFLPLKFALDTKWTCFSSLWLPSGVRPTEISNECLLGADKIFKYQGPPRGLRPPQPLKNTRNRCFFASPRQILLLLVAVFKIWQFFCWKIFPKYFSYTVTWPGKLKWTMWVPLRVQITYSVSQVLVPIPLCNNFISI